MFFEYVAAANKTFCQLLFTVRVDKLSGCDAGHSSPYSAEVENE
jgi:hypothetical protein